MTELRDLWLLEFMTEKIAPGLTSVPETMLWTLHNRASEAMRPDGILKDEEGVRIYKSIDYDYERSFRKADGTHAVRAITFDREIRAWIASHPEGMVVALGEGLETQCKRVDNGKIRWLSIDLPESIEVRERFIKPTDRFQHLGMSAFDFTWMDRIDASKGLFITAQGLFMYFNPDDVKKLLQELNRRFPNATLMFDTSPVWMKNLTMRGWQKTKTYKVPLMPWGIDKHEIKPLLRSWLPSLKTIEFFDFIYPRGSMKALVSFVLAMPYLKQRVPVMIKVQF